MVSDDAINLKKIDEVLDVFFNSLKSEDNKMLETGLSQNESVIEKNYSYLIYVNDPVKFGNKTNAKETKIMQT